GFRFPAMTDVGEEVVARGQVLRQFKLSSVAVVADSGGRDEHFRPDLLNPLDEVASANDAAPADESHLGASPSSARQGFAGKMNDGIRSFDGRRLRHGIPSAVPGTRPT